MRFNEKVSFNATLQTENRPPKFLIDKRQNVKQNALFLTVGYKLFAVLVLAVNSNLWPGC